MSLGTLVVELTANVAKFQSDLGRAEQMARHGLGGRYGEFLGVITEDHLEGFGFGFVI